MTNRFPLIVNEVSKKIEELITGDNLDLTGNNIIANNSGGVDGQYLKTNGTSIVWDNPGDVYLTATQTLTNKTLTDSVISGSSNTISNIPNSSLTNSSITVNGVAIALGESKTINLTQITEIVVNAFNTTLSPSTGTLTIDTSLGSVILGDLNASVTTWAFTNVPTANSKATTITLIIDGDTAQTYGDACSVNGSAITGGVKWSGGSAPTATNNFDIITFTIIRDNAGTVNVFGSGNTNFS